MDNNKVLNVLKSSQFIDIEIPDSTHELKAWLIDQENRLAREAAKQGFGFLQLQQQIEKGEFKDWLSSNGFSEQRVYEQISIAKMLISAPESERPKLLGISKSKLIALAKLPEETIAEITETGEIDELSRLSVRELKDRIRKLENDKADKAVQLETLKDENKQIRRVKYQSTQPEFYIDATEEITANAEKIMLCIESLERHFEELDNIYATTQDDDLRSYCEKAQQRLAIHLHGVAAKLQGFLNITKDLVSTSTVAAVMYDDNEVKDVFNMRRSLISEHEVEELMRKSQRDARRPKKRGRPAKAEEKAS